MTKDSRRSMTDSKSRKRRSGIPLYLAGLAMLAVAIFGERQLGERQRAAVAGESQARNQSTDAGPRVDVITVAASANSRTVTLIGEARPFSNPRSTRR